MHKKKDDFSKGKTELEERRRRSLLPWHRSKDRSKSKDRLLSGGTDARNGAASKNKRSLATAAGAKDSAAAKAKSLSASASRLVRGTPSEVTPAGAGVRSNSVSRVVSSRHPSDSSSSIGKTSDVSGSRTSLNSGCEGPLLAGRKAISKESLTSSDCVSLSGGEGSGGSATGRCRVVLPDRSQSVVAVRAGVSVDRVMRRLMDRRGLTFLAYNVVMAGKGDRLVSGTDDSSVLCGTEVRLQQLVLFRLDLPNQKTVCVKAKPHKLASDVLRPILAKYGFKLDLMHIHTAEDNPRPVNVKSQITELDGQKFIVQTKEDVKEWGLSSVSNGVGGAGSAQDSDALDAITNRVFEDLLQSKTSHQLLANCDYDARSAKTEACSDYSGSVCGSLSRHTALPDKARVGDVSAAGRISNTSTGNRSINSPCKDNDAELYEGLKRAQMSRIEDQRGTKINSELPDFLKCDSENKENEMSVDEPDEQPHFLPPDSGTAAAVSYFNNTRTTDHQHHPFYPQHHHHHHHFHYTSASQHQPHHMQLCPPEETCPSDEHSQYLPSSTTSLQPSSSSLTQHQAHHNFWSDISGGGSSIPSSLLATSSSSLSSSTGLPMSSSTNFEGIDTPLTIASNFLLDMHYDATELSAARAKLRPRPESCVNTRPDALMRPDQANRPKSSCGSLTASPDRTLIAPPDLDKTLSSNTSMDQTGDVFSDMAMRSVEAEEPGRSARLQASVRPVLQQQLRSTHYLRRHDHHHPHPSPMDCVMSQLVSSGSGGLGPSASHLSDFSPMVNSVDTGTNVNATGITVRANTNTSVPFNGNMSTPPPPLPPKPKLGAPARGPPPRPPSRQLPLGPPSSSGFVGGLLDGTVIKLRGPGPADMSSNQKLQNKNTVSFV
ncbi:Raf-like Ras-binding [Trinorchestia longiramus]|nr:Raf-like Ras-binding [Trinorchestia longiramus]